MSSPISSPMSPAIQLLGRPRIAPASGDPYEFRSRKSWALLAYLILSERPPTRSQLASLLFAEADDPVRALRWNLSEIRRGLGHDGSIDGDPVVLQLPTGTVVDVEVVIRGAWAHAVGLPGLGADLLEGMAVRGAPAFETWLLSEQRHVAAASEAILHEAALASMSRGELDTALGYAVRAAAMSPLDENHQALLIRLYRLAGDDAAAAQQFAAYTETFHRELGVVPAVAVEAAMRETQYERDDVADDATIEATSRPARLRSRLALSKPGSRRFGLRRDWPTASKQHGFESVRVSYWPWRSSTRCGVSTKRAWRRCTKLTRSHSPMTSPPPWHRRGPNLATSTSFGVVTTEPSCGSPMR